MRLYRFLRRLRIGVSLFFFAATLLLFIDIHSLFPPETSGVVLYLQFIPSLFDFLSGAELAALGFIIIIIATLITGRAYCSSICPLGTMQDIITYLRRKFFKRKRFTFLPEQRILRYGILAASIVSLFLGSMILINLLDPYSSFGRMSANLLRIPLIYANNGISGILSNFDIYSINPIEMKAVPWAAIILSLSLFGLVGWLSFTNGRSYCNTVCPLGTLLGLLSKVSLFRFTVEQSVCSDCGACEKMCKASCIESSSKNIDMSRCILCFDCTQVCITNAVVFQYRWKNDESGEPAEVSVDESKRGFMKSIAAFGLASAGLHYAQVAPVITTENTIPVNRITVSTPPGSKGIENFTYACTACHLCISACPTQVLQPSFLEYGLLGIMQPVMKYNAGFCNFECAACGAVCPTGAIVPLDLPAKKRAQIGIAKFVKDNCVVITQKTDCGACSEHCPTKAVKMVPHENRFLPEVTEDICIGCGACEYACPTKPYKAIYVEGNYEHKIAKEPDLTKPDYKYDPKADFNF